MDNVYGTFSALARMYQVYYDTPFALRDSCLAGERRALIETEGNVYREPFIEAIPRFVTSNKTVADACAALDLGSDVASFLTSGLFGPSQQLYSHQWDAWKPPSPDTTSSSRQGQDRVRRNASCSRS